MKLKSFLSCALIGLIAINQNAFAITINQTLDLTSPLSTPAYSASTGSQEGRIFRGGNGTGSVCDVVSPNPGEFTASGFHQFDQYRFVALTTGCVTVTLSGGGNDLLFAVAYNENGVNVGDTSLNYLADIGLGPTDTFPSTSFSFNVVSEQIFNIVIHEVNVGGAIGQAYTLDIDGVKLQPDFSITEVLDATAPVSNPADDGITGFQTGRLNRFTGSSCQNPTANPGLFTASGSRQLDFYEFIPTTTGCAVFSISHSGSGSLQLIAYDENGFNPFSPSENYLADTGSSATNKTKTMSMNVVTGVPFYVVINEVDSGASLNASYTLNISNESVVHRIQINSRLGEDENYNTPDWTSSTGHQVGRLSRDASPTNCNLAETSPAVLNLLSEYLYDSYTFIPTATGCVEVTLSTFDANIFSAAYDEMSINPADPSANYLADAGASTGNPSNDTTFGFKVTAGVPFTVVVSEVNTNFESGKPYKLVLRGKALYPLQGDVIFEDSFEE